jgi:predicted PurR-regulated permease PerM
MAQPDKDRIFPRWLLVLVGIGIIGLLLYALRGALTPVFFAFLIAYMLDPVVDRFEARGFPRSFGIGVMLTVVLGALALFVGLAVPGIAADISSFFHELPVILERGQARLAPFLADFGVEVPGTMSEMMDQLGVDSQQLAKAVEPAGRAVGWVVGGTFSILGTLAGLIMVPVFAAYLLHDFDRITAGVGQLIPPKWRPFVVDVAKEVDTVLGEFIRGQLIVMLILAVLYSVAYAVLDVRLAVLIGLVAGVLSFIPYVGGALALGLALVMCLIDWNGWWQVGGVVAAYTVIQLLEGFVITPRVVGEKVGLPAIWVLFALMVGGELFGFMGILLALPAAAVSKIFVMRGLAWYRSSEFFHDGGEPLARKGVFSALLRAEGLPDDSATALRKQQANEAPEGEDG